jgi:hypothetical protein
MNLSQAESFLAKAKRTSDRTGRPVKNLPAVKTYDPRTDKARKKAAFLQAFEKCCSIARSARFAGIDRTTHYEWVAKDAKYKAEFEMRVLMASDAIKDELIRLGVKGVFEPAIYKGKFCYAPRERIICQLADGTSAFQDELPKGAKVTGSRTVEVYDGEMIGRYKRSECALMKLLSAMPPEEFGNTARRESKPRAR